MKRQLGRPCDLPVSIVSLDELLNGSVRRYPCVAALGAFDGVHLGHQAILESAREKAQALGGCSIALTFDRLPAEVLKPKQAPMLITLPEARFSLLERMVDEVVVIPFDQQLIHLEATDFIEQALIKGLGTVGVVVGFNYTFGKGAKGTAELLQRCAAANLLNVTVVPPVEAVGQCPARYSETHRHREMGLARPSFQTDGQVSPVMRYALAICANVAVDLIYHSRCIRTDSNAYTNNPARDSYVTPSAIGRYSPQRHLRESFVLDYDRSVWSSRIPDFPRLRDIRRFTMG